MEHLFDADGRYATRRLGNHELKWVWGYVEDVRAMGIDCAVLLDGQYLDV